VSLHSGRGRTGARWGAGLRLFRELAQVSTGQILQNVLFHAESRRPHSGQPRSGRDQNDCSEFVCGSGKKQKRSRIPSVSDAGHEMDYVQGPKMSGVRPGTSARILGISQSGASRTKKRSYVIPKGGRGGRPDSLAASPADLTTWRFLVVGEARITDDSAGSIGRRALAEVIDARGLSWLQISTKRTF